MKLVFIFLVFVFGYIQTNGEGVSECYFCNTLASNVTCDEPEVQKCPTEQDNICMGLRLPNLDGTYFDSKQCNPYSPEFVESCAQINQTFADEGGYCYTCNEDLCNIS